MSNNEELSLFCKKGCGMDAKEVADNLGVPRSTFYNWWNNRRRVVEVLVKGLNAEGENVQ